MVIVPQYHCRFGNNVSQYAFPRIVAEHLGFAFSAPALLRLPNSIPGSSHAQPRVRVSDFDNHPVDATAILNDRSPRMLVMEGHFQQGRLYESHRDEIREWFASSLQPSHEASGMVVAHVRLGDYQHYGWALPPAYYAWCAREINVLCQHCRCLVCTDGNDAEIAPYLEAMAPIHPTLTRNSDGLQDLSLLMGARFVIVGNSTFGWWGAFWSRAEAVWLPHNWQPWGVGQHGDRHLGAGALYPSDMRAAIPGWHTVDMAGGVPK